jgi:hypothetical protein
VPPLPDVTPVLLIALLALTPLLVKFVLTVTI